MIKAGELRIPAHQHLIVIQEWDIDEEDGFHACFYFDFDRATVPADRSTIKSDDINEAILFFIENAEKLSQR